jgi:hypothetical protein
VPIKKTEEPWLYLLVKNYGIPGLKSSDKTDRELGIDSIAEINSLLQIYRNKLLN